MEDKIRQIILMIHNWINDQVQKLPEYAGDSVAAEMGLYELQGGEKGWNPLNADFTNSDKLIARTGKLARSFNSSSTKVNISGELVNAQVGSDLVYAKIQNDGGFIAAKNFVTKQKTLKSGELGKLRTVSLMELHFWSMWFKSNMGNPFFKQMALAVKKNLGVTIPPRPYLDKAMIRLQDYYQNKFLPNLLKEVIEVFNA